MGKWKGIMKSGFLEIVVNVTFTRAPGGLGVWRGSGETEKYWPMNQPRLETNIGTVLISKNTIRSNGKHYIEFQGSGSPKGPLAEQMD